MSFRRPKVRYKQHPPSTSTTPPSFPSNSSASLGNFLSLFDAPRIKRPRHSKPLFLPGPEKLLALPGVTLTQNLSTASKVGTRKRKRRSTQSASDQESTEDPTDDAVSQHDYEFSTGVDEHDLTRQEHQRRKRDRQRSAWMEEIIPSLVPHYLRILRETESFRLPVQTSLQACSCASGRSVNVICVYFHCLESITLHVCSRTPAALHLLSKGLFPCAPRVPSLAVDISLLRFTRDLFVRMPPNMTSFTDAMESFLTGRGYEIQGQVSLRRRFSSAFNWYGALVDATNSQIQAELERVRRAATAPDHSLIAANPGQEQPVTSKPVEYLRQRCPLCFGGNLSRKTHAAPDIIVCLDACFTQKRRKTTGDNCDSFGRDYPPTFVPEADVEAMENHVKQCREAGRNKSHNSTGDRFEGPLKVPASILDGCNESFTAADENRRKASTQFFSDTGLMAMLCRHDRVLWLVNMTSAGEKQHYALALLKRLFQHIPDSVTVGVLYDIACQLHRSFVKQKLLPEYANRLIFGLSVFHAYGHQWPCQLIYHPRKCPGFGFSDGEGCERFWSSIKKLIPNLRVTGFHQRLSILDTQVRHVSKSSLAGLGDWLARKWYLCQDRKREAQVALRKIKTPEHILRQQWIQQIKKQTSPVPRQSKDAGKREIEAILGLEESLKSHQQRVRELEGLLAKDSTPGFDVIEITEQLKDARASCVRVTDSVRRRRAALGISQRAALQKVKESVFLQIQMNSRALKTRIRDRLRQRKFELERLERSYRQVISEHKLSQQMEASVKRREPGIMKLVKTYNDCCQQMKKLAQQQQAPRYAYIPPPIDPQNLFTLDVDDEIWQDGGLDIDDGDAVPLWLGSDDVRTGIKYLLVLDRCQEEEERLRVERETMQLWMCEEWATLQQALVLCDDIDIHFQLKLQCEELIRICVRWQAKVSAIPTSRQMHESWGPSQEQLLGECVPTAAADYLEDSLDDDSGDEGSIDVNGEDDLFNDVESIALSDGYGARSYSQGWSEWSDDM